jgi:RNA polymerase sigma-70 factor (ECF subfamily)
VFAAREYYPKCPEALIVSLARDGDRRAFEELVNRRQSAVRHLMRRCCRDGTLADDLAQQVFLQVWLKLPTLRDPNAFGGWLKQLAVSIWLQYLRRNDALNEAGELSGMETPNRESPGVGMDLDEALGALPAAVRLCLALAYQEGMSHREIAEATGFPLGTVKSHITRGSERLREMLADYQANQAEVPA